MKTRMADGKLSPKTIMAAVLPTLGTLVAVGVQWGVTGEFDRAEFVTAVSGVAAALLSALGAWAAQPGPVVEDRATPRRRRRARARA